jgi:phage terminase large subunit-like protein
VFSEERAQRALRFIQHLPQTKGEWADQPFILADWQRDDIIRPLFGTVNADGNRQYRTAYVEIPRKNGKSTLAAGVALYMLFGDGEQGTEIYGAAADRDQASIVFLTAAEMVRRSAILSARAKIVDSTKRIVVHGTGSFYRAIPADAAGSHGFNAGAVLFDEVHTQPNRDLWDVLTTSTGARRQPLVFAITTAGYDRNSICYELHDYALKVQAGVVNDPTFFAYVKSAPEGADWTDEAVWRACNPAIESGFRNIDEMRQMCARAKETPALENTFRRLYLNQWTRQETRWLPLAAWDECDAPIDLEALKGQSCYAGLDLASTTDIAALVLVFPQLDGTFDVLPFFWVPGDSIQQRVRRDRVPYDLWARQGHIIATEGNVIDYKSIMSKFDELARLYDVREVGFDRWGATQLVQDMSDAGLSVVAVGQGYASMSPATKQLLHLVLGKKLRHAGNPVLRWMADNMVVTTDSAGNIKPAKDKSTERIDGMVALAMAVDRAARVEGESVYNERGLLVL